MSDAGKADVGTDAWAPPPDRTIEAYPDTESMRAATKKFIHPTTRHEERVLVYHRLRASGIEARLAMPTLLESLGRQDIETRHKLLDLFLAVFKYGASLGHLADDIARHLNDSHPELRDRVSDILVEMGAAAEGAAMRALGCTRHANEDVRMASVRVLGAIGASCAQQALPRLEQMLAEARTSEANKTVIQEAIENLKAGPAPAPVSDRLQQLREQPVDLGTQSQVPDKPFDGLRILVVEDTMPMRKIVVKVLTKSGACVAEAGDGVEALEALVTADTNGTSFDLVLLDLMMPRLNGLQCLQKMRQMQGWEKTPVICMSAVKEKQAIAVAVQLGIIDYILKPFKVEKVIATVKKNIESGDVSIRAPVTDDTSPAP